MDLIPAMAGMNESRGIVRGARIARVKFVALPIDNTRPGPRLGDSRGRLTGAVIRSFVLRVIGRLVAARP